MIGYYFVSGAEPSHFTLRAGSSIRETGGSVHQIKRIIQHPNFNEQTADYDYALIEVAVPFDLTQPGIKTIALAVTDPAVGEIGTVSGWGKLTLSLEYDGFHLCGATVISETWALSATHCVK
ncbi:Spermathecal endopeptidase 1 [Carabus blaptoides fortunei]